MRKLVLWASAYILAGLSAAWAARYGIRDVDTMWDALLKGGALFMIAIVGVHSMAWSVRVFRDGSKWVSIVIAGVGMLCFLVTATGGIGTIASISDRHQASRDDAIKAKRADRGELDRAVGERETLPFHRPVSTLRPLLDIAKSNPRFAASQGCQPNLITRPDTRELCSEYRKTESELGTAQRAEELDRKITEIRSRLAAQGPVKEANPLAQNLSALLNISPEKAEALYAAGVAFALDLAALATVLTHEISAARGRNSESVTPRPDGDEQMTLFPMGQEPAAAHGAKLIAFDPRPKGDVATFLAESLQPEAGREATAEAAFDQYVNWCSLNEREPIGVASFTLHFLNLCERSGILTRGDGEDVTAIDVRLSA